MGSSGGTTTTTVSFMLGGGSVLEGDTTTYCFAWGVRGWRGFRGAESGSELRFFLHGGGARANVGSSANTLCLRVIMILKNKP